MFLRSYFAFVTIIIQACFIIRLTNAQTVRSSSTGTAKSTPEPEIEYYEYDDVTWAPGDDDRDRNRTRDRGLDRNDADTKEKFFSTPTDIVLENVDFVTLRLRHIINQTTTNLKELKDLQMEEFSKNSIYKEGWAEAKEIFLTSTKKTLRRSYPKRSPVHKVPEEYHIALISYSLQYPSPTALFSDFNAQTRELCSGKDILAFQYKSYFRLLELATESLGRILKPKTKAATRATTATATSNPRFLYRGVGRSFALKEGQLLAFQHFISTSIDLKIAEQFSGGGSLFEFDGEYQSSFGVYLGSHSYFEDEEEVLLSPLQIFQVDSIHEGASYKRYVLKSRPLKDPNVSECEYEAEYKNFKSGSSKGQDQDQSIRTLTTTVAILGGLLGAAVAILLIAVVIGLVVYRRGGGTNRTISEMQLS